MQSKVWVLFVVVVRMMMLFLQRIRHPGPKILSTLSHGMWSEYRAQRETLTLESHTYSF